MADIPTPQHMDGRSILPLLKNRHRNIRGKWPDTFLIESSGRRETAEQLMEQRAKAQAAKMLEQNNIDRQNLTSGDGSMKNDTLQLHFSSHEDIDALDIEMIDADDGMLHTYEFVQSNQK